MDRCEFQQPHDFAWLEMTIQRRRWWSHGQGGAKLFSLPLLPSCSQPPPRPAMTLASALGRPKKHNFLKGQHNDQRGVKTTFLISELQCVRATFTLAVVVTVVNQKSPKSPVGGISPNLWTKTCRVSNSDWKNGITSVISLAQSKLRSIGRRANQPPLTFCPLAWFLGKLF